MGWRRGWRRYRAGGAHPRGAGSRSYPETMPRGNAQFNFLYEQRSRMAELIERLNAASNRDASGRELIKVVEDFVTSAPLLESSRERELRDRLRTDIDR